MPKKQDIKIKAAKPEWPVRKLCLLLAIISFLVYANTLENGYVLDDVTVTTGNTIVTRGIQGIPELLTTPRLSGYSHSTDAESYRPVPLIISAIEYQVFGANAAEGHFSNILFFIGCVIALFLLLDSLFDYKKTGVAFVASLLFALHPIHTEVVANIKSRDELLCFLFAFLALIFFVRYARAGNMKQLLAGTVLLFLSYLSKETVISFLFVVPLVFFFCVNEDKKRSVLICAATVVTTICFFGIRAAVLHNSHPNVLFIPNPLVAVTDTATRVATATMVLGMYLKLLVLPYPLICDYGYNSIPVAGFGNVFVLLSLAAYVSFAIIGIYRLFTKPKDPWAFAILFFLGTLALFSNIPFLVYSELAERFLFFASAGFCVAAALAFERWVMKGKMQDANSLKNKRALIVLAPICIVLFLLTIARNSDWQDNYTLFSADLKKAPKDCELNFYLGCELSQKMYAEETNPATQRELIIKSIGYLNDAITIYPDFDGAHAELGRIYDMLQMFDSAIVQDKRALAVNPVNSIAAYNLARSHYFLKQYPEAIAAFKKTIALQPGIMLSNLNLGLCYFDYHQYDSAAVYLNKTLAIDPQQQIALQRLSLIQTMKSQPDTANRQQAK